MPIEDLRNARKVIGVKQSLKAVEKQTAEKVFLAADADLRVTQTLKEMCSQKGVAVETAPTMSELGKACGIEVGAAAVAVVKL